MTKPHKYGVSGFAVVPIIKAGAIDYSTSSDYTPAAGDVKVSKDGAAFVNVATLPTAVGNMWKFVWSSSEAECEELTFQIVDSATKAVEDQGFKQWFHGDASAAIAFDLDNATPTVNTTKFGGTTVTGRDLGASVLLSSGSGSGQVSLSSGHVGINWANVANQSTSVTLTNTTVATATNLTNLPASAATAAALTTVDTVVDAIKAITDQFVFTVANQVDSNALTGGGGLDAAGVRSAVGLAAANLDTQLANIPTVAEFNARSTTDPATETLLTTVAGYLDTEIAAIKAVTDQFVFTVANQVDANALTGGGGLDAAGVRAAVGLASADLDTQLGGLSTHSAADVLTAFGTGSALSALTTAVGFSTHSAADVLTAFGTGSALSACLTATGFSTHDAAAVVTALGTGGTLTECLTATGFSTHSAADVLTAFGTGSTLSALTTAVGFSTHDAAAVVTALGDGSTLTTCATATGFATPTNVTDAQTAIVLEVDANEVKIDAVKAITDQFVFTVANQVDANALTGGGGLDAAGVRSAIGLAAADLDTQLDDLPTAGEIDTELTSSHGAGSWAAAGAGSGGSVVTITVDDGTNPLENATVRLYEGANNHVSTTGADGIISPTIGADDATFNVVITKDGYKFTPTTLVVSGNTAQTYSMTVNPSPTSPASPSLCTLGTYLFSGATPIEGGTFKAKLVSTNNAVDTAVLSLQILTDTTDANGYAELQLVRADQFTDGDGIYQIYVLDADGLICTDVKITIPNAATALLEDYLP